MRSLFVVAALLCVAAALALPRSEEQTFASFMDFTRRFNKQYSSMDEFNQRYANFLSTLDRIEQLNADGGNVFGITKFADLTPEEFKATYLGFRPSPHRHGKHVTVAEPQFEASGSFDWRDNKGFTVVSAVKDQGQCGSCWAFSAVEEVESMEALARNASVQVYSEQQVVSCDTKDGGCDGGDTITAYDYLVKAGGVETESSYPYTSGNGKDGSCNVTTSKFVAKISGYTYATTPCFDSCAKQDEATLLNNMVSTGPVSICVEAEPWQDYNGGILSSNCAKSYNSLDHCVQLVGYNDGSGSDANTAYWIIRNSWAADWGEDGYIYVKYGSNLCGVADEATFVTISN